MASPGDLPVIQNGDHVMLKKADKLRLFQICKSRDVWLEKHKFTLDGLIGHPYGTLFEVKDGKMVKVDRIEVKECEKSEKEGICTEKDNRHLLDQDSNQKLTQDEIEQMKREGVSGDHLIGRLIENSATFQGKTGYAQEKWVKKKKKKHLLQFSVLKPCTRLMCEMQWSKGPSRICNLRIDSLAQMLTMGNVHANSTVMVVDSCLGLVTGAVLERLGGFGKVISFYEQDHGDNHLKTAMESYDFPKNIMDTLHRFPLELVNSLKSSNGTEQEACMPVEMDINLVDGSVTSNLLTQSELESGTPLEIQSESLPAVTQSEEPSSAKADRKSDKWPKKGKKRNQEDKAELKRERAKDIEIARNIISQRNVDCLIVASKCNPTPIVLALVDYVAPSRQVVVFSQFKEALLDCYTYLREQKALVTYRLTETWLREYQVLPNRTHPVIQMSGTGGYILTATTIVNSH